ncbi:hypothetical protein BGX23_001811 [Mortierella sp. AD031]|nr:hypothetical protein BGX23_001811 [Mortierella sp. AD031]
MLDSAVRNARTFYTRQRQEIKADNLNAGRRYLECYNIIEALKKDNTQHGMNEISEGLQQEISLSLDHDSWFAGGLDDDADKNEDDLDGGDSDKGFDDVEDTQSSLSYLRKHRKKRTERTQMRTAQVYRKVVSPLIETNFKDLMDVIGSSDGF